MTHTSAYQKLLNHLRELYYLEKTAGLLIWDQQTYLPSQASEERAEQLAVLSVLIHKKFASRRTEILLTHAKQELGELEPDSTQARLLELVAYELKESSKLPSSFIGELSQTTSLAHDHWARARAQNDFSIFAPSLEKIVALCQKQAEYLGFEEHPYDALVNQYERGMTTSQLTKFFASLEQPLQSLLVRIQQSPVEPNTDVLRKNFPAKKQEAFALWVIEKLGFDLARGRQDISAHPFQITLGSSDVRLTTRFDENFLNPALFGLMHEAGHGMYEQNVSRDLAGTVLAGGTSLGIHESQSRLWENIIGRSQDFWHWAYPELQKTFPAELAGTSERSFYEAINAVSPSFIRVEADEVTYNLHILLRFELEKRLIEGSLRVADLPEAWNHRFTELFGVTPPTAAEGVLQDVHWSGGSFGYFATYSLGTVLSAQFFAQAKDEVPSIQTDIELGQFASLKQWLGENIHQHGRKFTGKELVKRVTGGELNTKPYIAYLEEKFGELYKL
jgi:carboxypeptidase Taq